VNLSIFALIFALSILRAPTRDAPFDFEQWLNDELPRPGSTLKDNLKCYTLPFGAIGFVSHLLTYYTVLLLGLGRSPWCWKPLADGLFDIAFAVLGLVCTLAVTILAMIRCRGQWQFVLLAFWKLAMSLTLSITTIHASILVLKNATRPKPRGVLANTLKLLKATANKAVRLIRKGETGQAPPELDISEAANREPEIPEGVQELFGWLAIYVIGITVGFVGLFSLVKKSWDIPRVQALTLGWIVLLAMSVPLSCLILNVSSFRLILPLSFVSVADSMGITGALYSDWILAAIAGNYGGIPDGNNLVLYWSYFAAKRLPFLSF
jgi:hypothetical protein